MTRLFLILTCLSLLLACDSGTSNSTASNTNVANDTPYSQTENVYTSDFTDVEIAPLKAFVGKTASEMKLWQNKAVVRRLKLRMGDDFATMVKFWNSETPLKKFGDVLMLTGCERDNCVNNRYVIFFSTSEGLLRIVHIGKDTIREWKTRATFELTLPPPFAEELLAMKARK